MVSNSGDQPKRHFDIEAQNKLVYGQKKSTGCLAAAFAIVAGIFISIGFGIGFEIQHDSANVNKTIINNASTLFDHINHIHAVSKHDKEDLLILGDPTLTIDG